MVLATLGIAVTSWMASSVLKGDAAIPSLAPRQTSSGDGALSSAGGVYWRYLDRPGNFLVTVSESDASFADLLAGETHDNTSDIDISRLHNLVVTCTLVTGYLALTLGMIDGVAGEAAALILHASKTLFILLA